MNRVNIFFIYLMLFPTNNYYTVWKSTGVTLVFSRQWSARSK